jgi:hypothetical protein
MSAPVIRWRLPKEPDANGCVVWCARYLGWRLYVGEKLPSTWFISLHRPGKSAACRQLYPTLEGAQNAAEFYAEQGRWPHDKQSAPNGAA